MDRKEQINELMQRLRFPAFEGFPDIELYMDQVVDFLSRSSTSLRDDDRLSSAMVNNYIKAEILPRARGKKYSKEHLAYLTVIIRLKQVLSVKDTGELIKASKIGKDDEEFYNNFRERQFNALDRLAEYLISSEESPADMAMELAVQSYLYKVACEYLIDQIVEEFWHSSEKTETGKREKDTGAPNKGGKK